MKYIKNLFTATAFALLAASADSASAQDSIDPCTDLDQYVVHVYDTCMQHTDPTYTCNECLGEALDALLYAYENCPNLAPADLYRAWARWSLLYEGCTGIPTGEY